MAKAGALNRPLQQQQQMYQNIYQGMNQMRQPYRMPSTANVLNPSTPPYRVSNGYVPYSVGGRQVGTMYAPNQQQQPYAENPWYNPGQNQQYQQQMSYQDMMQAYVRAMSANMGGVQ